jgi:transketolase N-terminal domain/subunit
VLALLTYELMADKQAQLAGKVHHIPDMFVQLCQGAVGAGVAALSVSIAAGIATAYRIAFKQSEDDDYE